MATKKEMYEIIGRIVADAEFRASLVENPEGALKEAGYTVLDRAHELRWWRDRPWYRPRPS